MTVRVERFIRNGALLLPPSIVRTVGAVRGLRAIARETGLARDTVRGWLAAGRPPTWRRGERPSIVDPFLSYLQGRLAEGCGNATALWKELQDRGFRSKVVVVRAWVARLKGGPARTAHPAKPVWRPPNARQATRMLLSSAHLPEMDAAFVAALPEGEVGVGADLAHRFAALVRERNAAALGGWLDDARIGPLAGFAESLRRDRGAVEAALSTPWSTGPVEGKITKEADQTFDVSPDRHRPPPSAPACRMNPPAPNLRKSWFHSADYIRPPMPQTSPTGGLACGAHLDTGRQADRGAPSVHRLMSVSVCRRL